MATLAVSREAIPDTSDAGGFDPVEAALFRPGSFGTLSKGSGLPSRATRAIGRRASTAGLRITAPVGGFFSASRPPRFPSGTPFLRPQRFRLRPRDERASRSRLHGVGVA